MANLKLMAMDEEDLTILSAHCQDAVFKAADINWLAHENRVLIQLRRFAWEEASAQRGLRSIFGRKSYERRLSVLHFERVTKLATVGVNPASDDVFDVLSISFEPDDSGVSGMVIIDLAGGAALRLDVECVEARLADLGGAWETRHRPKHPK